MSDNSGFDPADFNNHGFNPEELKKMLQEAFGQDGFNQEALAKAAGLSANPESMSEIFAVLNAAVSGSNDASIDWSRARNAALKVAANAKTESTEQIANVEQAINNSLTLATAWLDENTHMASAAASPLTLERTQWVTATIDTWIDFAKPVAESISEAMTAALSDQLPTESQSLVAGATQMFNRIGGAMFAAQLGSAVGNLATEVFSAGDIGVPVVSAPKFSGGSLVPANIASFAKGLDQNLHDVVLYLTVRELAHARLFKHAKWLRAHIIGAITDYARGIHIDVHQIETSFGDFDPHDTTAINEMLSSGALIPPKTDLQEQAHERLSMLLALIEGWVDAVTAQATKNIAASEAIAEMIRRRRVTQGPAEKVFGTLVGLELRPSKLREAAKMWTHITLEAGPDSRDSLWQHPDLLPTEQELKDPQLLLERIKSGSGTDNDTDEFARDLAKLLDGEFDND